MAELYTGDCAFGFKKARDAFEFCDLAIFPEAQISVGTPASGFDTSGIGKDQTISGLNLAELQTLSAQ